MRHRLKLIHVSLSFEPQYETAKNLMNYFAFPLKCRKLYKKINGASKFSYKSSNTRSPFLRSITGGSPYISDVEGRFVFLLEGRNRKLSSHLEWPGRKANIFSMQVSSRAR